MPRFPDPEVPSAAVADNNIIGEVRQALGESPDVDVRDLLVDSSGGIVQLTGAVRTLHEKQTAGKLALSAEGAKGVENNLVVVADKQPSDSEIECAIEKVLGNYPEGRPARIGVRIVENGVAYLAGKASSGLESWNAVALVAKVPGVKKIVNEIDVAPGEPVNEVELKNLVNDSLSRDLRVHPFDINVQVENEDVYLEGDVEDEETRCAAEEIASGTAGVKRVYNNIKVM
ncbi:MAG: BON domain-containing protein [Armatimonadota bacterium]